MKKIFFLSLILTTTAFAQSMEAFSCSIASGKLSAEEYVFESNGTSLSLKSKDQSDAENFAEFAQQTQKEIDLKNFAGNPYEAGNAYKQAMQIAGIYKADQISKVVRIKGSEPLIEDVTSMVLFQFFGQDQSVLGRTIVLVFQTGGWFIGPCL